MRYLVQRLLFYISEEKLLHEEIDLKWEDIQSWGLDFHIMEKLRSELVVGVSILFFFLQTVFMHIRI